MDPKTAGLRALNRALELFRGKAFRRLTGSKSLAEEILGGSLYDPLEALAQKKNITTEEMLILVMYHQLVRAKISIEDSWIIKLATEIANNTGGQA
ncbi:MAG TPA: hypothetical protein P5186_19935 [Candidatus Paceibacterota bacterium]|nr:hypothetical protein [Verrucomicrobiota bacterium]HRY50330.1 hypothetical protein [Candidatus Paceibacterota bacterium]